MSDHDTAVEAPSTTFDTIGVVCARASFVAVLLGIVEGVVVSRQADVAVSGIGIATAGLWFPAALLFLLPASLLRRRFEESRRTVAMVLGIVFLATIVFANVAKGVPHVVRAGALEGSAALSLAWVASLIEFEDPLRKPLAIAGIVVAIALQIFGTHWIDDHRAFASLLLERSLVPRLMLKTVLHRFV